MDVLNKLFEAVSCLDTVPTSLIINNAILSKLSKLELGAALLKIIIIEQQFAGHVDYTRTTIQNHAMIVTIDNTSVARNSNMKVICSIIRQWNGFHPNDKIDTSSNIFTTGYLIDKGKSILQLVNVLFPFGEPDYLTVNAELVKWKQVVRVVDSLRERTVNVVQTTIFY